MVDKSIKLDDKSSAMSALMRSSLILLLMVSLQTTYGQKSDNKIVIGQVKTLYSNILKEKRPLWIAIPAHFQPRKKYPVLYLLDASEHFIATVGMAKQLEGPWPEMIIVGIQNTIRNRDLTPTHVNADELVDDDFAKVSGGGENFLRFMEKELIPYIDSLYPTTNYRLFSGHSLGGLTVINAFIHHPALFQAYIAMDPSLWWEQQQLVKQAEKILATRHFDRTSLFLAIANNMDPGLDTAAAQADTTKRSLLTRSILRLNHALLQYPDNGLRWRARFYPEERHGTVALNATYDALRFLFDFYQFRTSQFAEHPDQDVDSTLTAHFQNVSRIMGSTVLPSEQLVNDLAYTLLSTNKQAKAYLLFKRNTDNYPESANAHDSMGDYYKAVGNKQQAIKSYSRSLQLQEVADTRRKLNELKQP
jgi:predicted alpha/beta superfamily hydrolase